MTGYPLLLDLTGRRAVVVGGGVVAARRQGRWMHYRLTPPQDSAALAILSETLVQLRQMPEMGEDLAKLDTSCCNPAEANRENGPPQPSLVVPLFIR